MSPVRHTGRGRGEHVDAARMGGTAARRFVERTETAAFSCRSDGTVMCWNSGAERIFGRPADAAVRRRCYELVRGTDVFGNDFCSRHCAVREMARRNRPILPYRMDVRDGAGRSVGVRTMVLVLRDGDGDPELVHLFDPLSTAASPLPSRAPKGES